MDTITEKANNAAKSSSQDFGYLEATLADGSPIKIAKSALQKIIQSEVDSRAMQDGVFIMFHRKSDDLASMVKPEKWPELEKTGEVAAGVVVWEGDRHIVVAPTAAPEPLLWSTANIAGGGYTTQDRVAAINDWEGKASTAKQFEHAECKPATTAVGFCSTYARTNANGKGLTAGKWWLPSVAELIVILAHSRKINYALSFINEASPVSEDTWYWSSTEYNSSYACNVNFSNGRVSQGGEKAKGKVSVRAVSEFI